MVIEAIPITNTPIKFRGGYLEKSFFEKEDLPCPPLDQ